MSRFGKKTKISRVGIGIVNGLVSLMQAETDYAERCHWFGQVNI